MGGQQTQILLKVDQLNSKIQEEQQVPVVLAPIELAIHIVDRVLRANRSSKSLTTLREEAQVEGSPWTMEDGLLLYWNHLMVLDNDKEMQGHILNKIY
jgi:hypothetical protein